MTALATISGLVLRPGARDVSLMGVAVAGQYARLVEVLDAAAGRGAHVGIVTGTYIAWADPPAAETDGPVGAAVLALALERLGATPVLLTDSRCDDVTRACAHAVGVPVAVVDTTADDAEVRRWGAALALDVVLSVERLGPNASARTMTMRAVDITAHTAPLHVLFEDRNRPTGAVGDGGNEIGMGNVPLPLVRRSVEHADEIACRVEVDDLVVAGTSNWGCYGLVAGLRARAAEAHRLDGLLSPQRDAELVAAAVAAGGIDGVTGLGAMSVDGIPVERYASLLDALDEVSRRE